MSYLTIYNNLVTIVYSNSHIIRLTTSLITSRRSSVITIRDGLPYFRRREGFRLSVASSSKVKRNKTLNVKALGFYPLSANFSIGFELSCSPQYPTFNVCRFDH